MGLDLSLLASVVLSTRFKGATFSHPGKKYPSMIGRLYEHLREGGDITFKEMSLVDMTAKQKKDEFYSGRW